MPETTLKINLNLNLLEKIFSVYNVGTSIVHKIRVDYLRYTVFLLCQIM